MSVGPATPREILIATIADLLAGVRLVAVGASSPIPAAGAMLLRARNEARGLERVRIVVLGSREHNFFTNGAVELFDCAAQGRVDAFFLGGGQIDGQGNINLVGTGEYPKNDVRWPGSFGSAFLYYVVPRVILFREEHSPRVFVDKVDFVSAPGVSEGIVRNGGPYALLTGLALFDFDKSQKRFRLRSVHRGVSAADVRANTGFDYDEPADVPATPEPDAETLALLRGRVTGELAETYPQFAGTLAPSARPNSVRASVLMESEPRLYIPYLTRFASREPVSTSLENASCELAIPRSAATWSSPRSSAGAIGMPSRARAARVAWLRSPGT